MGINEIYIDIEICVYSRIMYLYLFGEGVFGILRELVVFRYIYYSLIY